MRPDVNLLSCNPYKGEIADRAWAVKSSRGHCALSLLALP